MDSLQEIDPADSSTTNGQLALTSPHLPLIGPCLYGWLVTPSFMGVHVFTDRLAFAAADWCFRLHGWPIMPPPLGVYDFTTGLPSPPPTGVSAYTADLLRRRCWASTSSPTGLPSSPPTGVSACTAGVFYAAVVGRPSIGVLTYTVGWSHHRSWASTSSPTGWPSPPPTGVFACTVGPLCRRCWASMTSPPACLRRRRVVSSPIRLVGHTTVHGCPRLCRPAGLCRH